MIRAIRHGAQRLAGMSGGYFVWIISAVALAFIVGAALVAGRVVKESVRVERSHEYARATAEALARSAFAPAIEREWRPGRALAPETQRELAVIGAAARRSGVVSGVTLWARDGTILYSDHPASAAGMPAGVRKAFRDLKQVVERGKPRRGPQTFALSLPIAFQGGPRPAAVLQVHARDKSASTSSWLHQLDIAIALGGLLAYLLVLPLLARAGRVLRREFDPRLARLIRELERGIERREFRIELQPLVDLRTGAVESAEALVRWDHPDRGRIPPDDFIPAAEASPFFWKFSLHVLDLALAEVASLERAGIRLPVAVNVSSADLLDPRLPLELRRLLVAHGVAADLLHLEVTETAIMAETDRAASVLGDVAAVGIGCIAIDDFGTGHSSLARVRDLPIDVLKIDRSFVAEMDSTDDSSLVRSIISLAHNLGLKVVAEGIESPETAARLGRLGCDLGQGYSITRPLPPEEVAPWLTRRGGYRVADGELEDSRRRAHGRRRDDYFALAFDNAPEPMLIADDARRWVDANRAACQLLGLTREEIRTRAPVVPVHEAELDSAWASLSRDGEASGRWSLTVGSSERRCVDFEASAQFLPGLHLFVLRPTSTTAQRGDLEPDR